jgi:hypothetical protein
MIGTGTDTSWFDPSVIDPDALPDGLRPKNGDPLGTQALGQSQPVPGVAHGSIPGLLGIALNGGGDGTIAPGPLWRPGGAFPTQAPAMPPGAPLPFMGPSGAPAAPPPMASPPQAPQVAPPSAPPLSLAPGADAMASAQPMPQSGAPPQGGNSILPPGSLLDRVINGIGNFRDQNRMTLLAMAGGLAGSQNWGTGLGRAFTAAVPAQQMDIQQNRLNQTAQALTARGLPPDLAMTAAQNPSVMQQLLPRLFGVKQQQFTQIGEDMFGNKRFGFVDPVNGQITPFEGSSPLGGGGGGGQGGPSAPGAASGMPGAVNQSLVGEDYLKQFPSEIQAAVKSYIGGESMPTGNPRAGFTQAVKMIAQKYGSDIGVPADDTTFNARRTMRTQLSTAAPNSLGGQINTGNTAIGHLADASDRALDLNNSNGMGFAPLAHAINGTYNALSTAQASKAEALNDSIQHYGQEITKFYAGSPGGEAERQRFLTTASAAKSPQELAAVFQTEAQLMQSRLDSLGSQIKGTLGPAAAQYPVVRPESQSAIDRLNTNVARLKGGAPPPVSTLAPASAAAPIRVTDQATYNALPKGTSYIAPDGTPRIKQ